MNGNPILGMSRVAWTVPWVAHCPVWVSVSVAMSFPPVWWARLALAAERLPAECPQGDEQAGGAPCGHDQQVQPGEAEPGGVRVVGDEQRVGQVPDREDLADVGEPVRQDRDRDEYPGDEVEREQERLGDRLGGVLVANHRGERVAQAAEGGGADDYGDR